MSAERIAQTDLATQAYGPVVGNRWVQLAAGVTAMVVISNFQYAFTLFTPGLKQQFASVPYSDIALIYTLFILFETWPVPVAGYFIDKFGIRNLMLIGSVLIFLGWTMGGTVATSVFHLYICYGVLAGTGAGIIYIATVANAVKWFPDKRGLAAGLTAAGFGGGSALTLIPISGSIASMGWAGAMATWGVGQGIVAMVMALILRHPPKGWLRRSGAASGKFRCNRQDVVDTRLVPLVSQYRHTVEAQKDGNDHPVLPARQVESFEHLGLRTAHQLIPKAVYKHLLGRGR